MYLQGLACAWARESYCYVFVLITVILHYFYPFKLLLPAPAVAGASLAALSPVAVILHPRIKPCDSLQGHR